MNEFYCSARGASAEEWLDEPKSRRMKLPYPPVKILFPSAKTVRESVLNEQVSRRVESTVNGDVDVRSLGWRHDVLPESPVARREVPARAILRFE